MSTGSNGKGFYRKIIKIRAEDSPNVRLAIAEMEGGRRRPDPILIKSNQREVFGRQWGQWTQEEYDVLLTRWKQNGSPDPPFNQIIPGVISYPDYIKRRLTWDPLRQLVGLDAEFDEGSVSYMFPKPWLHRSVRMAESLRTRTRYARSMGIDPAEGGDKTSWAIGDELGLIKLVSKRTPNTAQITAETIALGRQYNIPPEMWVFDRGGGGKQHADRLREQGFHGVQTVAFGESVAPEPARVTSLVRYEEKVDRKESRYAYFNRRAEMYGELSLLLDPDYERGFAIPQEYMDGMSDPSSNLYGQLSPIPKRFDSEGRLKLPPKSKKPGSTEECLIDIIGHSPDEADSLVLMLHGLTHQVKKIMIGAVI